MLSVMDFMEMLVSEEQEVCLWSNEEEGTVFEGKARDIPEEFMYQEITSIDPIENNVITLNI